MFKSELSDEEAQEAYEAQHDSERRGERASATPWSRAEIGVGLKWRDDQWWHANPPWLGPFGVGDEVIVNNGEMTGVIEYVNRLGMVVIPKAPATRDVQDAGAWVPATGVRSIAPVAKLPVMRAPYVAPADPPEVPDETAPMNPPPVQPRRGAMFG